MFKGGHNDLRPESFLDRASDFLKEHLFDKLNVSDEVAHRENASAPPPDERHRLEITSPRTTLRVPASKLPPLPEPSPSCRDDAATGDEVANAALRGLGGDVQAVLRRHLRRLSASRPAGAPLPVLQAPSPLCFPMPLSPGRHGVMTSRSATALSPPRALSPAGTTVRSVLVLPGCAPSLSQGGSLSVSPRQVLATAPSQGRPVLPGAASWASPGFAFTRSTVPLPQVAGAGTGIAAWHSPRATVPASDILAQAAAGAASMAAAAIFALQASSAGHGSGSARVAAGLFREHTTPAPTTSSRGSSPLGRAGASPLASLRVPPGAAAIAAAMPPPGLRSPGVSPRGLPGHGAASSDAVPATSVTIMPGRLPFRRVVSARAFSPPSRGFAVCRRMSPSPSSPVSMAAVPAGAATAASSVLPRTTAPHTAADSMHVLPGVRRVLPFAAPRAASPGIRSPVPTDAFCFQPGAAAAGASSPPRAPMCGLPAGTPGSDEASKVPSWAAMQVSPGSSPTSRNLRWPPNAVLETRRCISPPPFQVAAGSRAQFTSPPGSLTVPGFSARATLPSGALSAAAAARMAPLGMPGSMRCTIGSVRVSPRGCTAK